MTFIEHAIKGSSQHSKISELRYKGRNERRKRLHRNPIRLYRRITIFMCGLLLLSSSLLFIKTIDIEIKFISLC